MLSNSTILLKNLSEYYNNDTKKIKKILPIISGNSEISIRIIDWFVTNYSKKINVMYNLSNRNEPFVVWQDYKSQLKGWSKKFFDPFCRRERIKFVYKKDNGENDDILTTVGQLNFFKWALENKILDYIKKNLKEIENDMILNCKYEKKEDENTRRKRRELSVSASKSVNKHNVVITLKFN